MESGELIDGITMAARHADPDFIVLGIHHEDLRLKPAGGLHVGLVYQIVSHTAVPVLTLHDRLDVDRLRAMRSVSTELLRKQA